MRGARRHGQQNSRLGLEAHFGHAEGTEVRRHGITRLAFNDIGGAARGDDVARF